ncbi:MAG: hypothetical protein HYW85_07050 [Deltaproteobacteria bacterium]|nr:hypothetical protein [Deltaproteobacteria bacterium]MBI3017269.1 hypothetical protein [Deltaproteobacteria bacterium]
MRPIKIAVATLLTFFIFFTQLAYPFSECEQFLSEPSRVEHATIDDVLALTALDHKAWGLLGATSSKLASRVELFPEGQFKAISDKGAIEGFLNTQKVSLKPEETLAMEEASMGGYLDAWSFLTDNGFLKRTHSRFGEGLFLVNLTTDVSHGKRHRRQIGRQLILSALKFSKEQNLRFIRGVTRVNGFAAYLQKIYPEYATFNAETKHAIQKSEIGTYLNSVSEGQEKDPALGFHLREGASIIAAIENAMIGDKDSEAWGALISYDHRLFSDPALGP